MLDGLERLDFIVDTLPGSTGFTLPPAQAAPLALRPSPWPLDLRPSPFSDWILRASSGSRAQHESSRGGRTLMLCMILMAAQVFARAERLLPVSARL